MALPTFVLPGTHIGPASTWTSGPGTFVHNAQIFASIKGKPLVLSSSDPSSTSASAKPTISVDSPASPQGPIPSRNVTRRNVLPAVNSIVLAKVTRLQQRQVNVAISIVDDIVCADEFSGVVRREDVRGWEVDRVKVEEVFRVGDVVRAVVVSVSPLSHNLPQAGGVKDMEVSACKFWCRWKVLLLMLLYVDLARRSSIVLLEYCSK